MEYLPNIERQTNPYDKANFLSKFFYIYTFKLFMKGYNRDLEEEDLYEVPSALKSKKLGNKLEKVWNCMYQHSNRKNSSLIYLLLKCYGLSYFLLGLGQLFFKTAFIISRPILVAYFVSYVKQSQKMTSRSSISSYGLYLVALVLAESLYDQWYFFKLMVLKLQIRAAFSSLIYRKILKLSSLCRRELYTGKVLNLITKDVHNLELLIARVNEIWISIAQASVLFYILFQKVGFLVLILIIFFVVLLPLQVNLAMKSRNLQTKLVKETDSRYQATKDILSRPKMVKMTPWVYFLTDKLKDHRTNELQLTCRIFLLKFIISINATLWTCATFFPWMLIFIAVGQNPTTEIVAVLFASYISINNLLCVVLPSAICQVAQTLPTFKRIEEVLKSNEPPSVSSLTTKSKVRLENVAVTVRKETIFRNINFAFDTGLVIINGEVGSGKTTLIRTIMGDYECTRGTVTVRGSISYAPQEPWLFDSTIKQNVIFGEVFNEKRYNQVLEACDLNYDLHLLDKGDHTMIENGGLNLSKSQRIRINLARAVYKDSDIYLLDENLANLDPFQSEYIFEKCIRKFLIKKVVILVTKDAIFSNKSQNCVILNDGEATKTVDRDINDWEHFPRDSGNELTENIIEETPLLPKVQARNVYDEFKKVGEVSYKDYAQWIKNGGGFTYFFVITTFIVGLPIIMKYFEIYLLRWTLNEEKIGYYAITNTSDTPIYEQLLHKRRNMITVHIVLILALLICSLTTSIIFLNFTINASTKLHKYLIKNVLYSNLPYLIGNILNRCSKDLLNIDEVVPFLFYDLYTTVIPITGTALLIVSVQNILLVPLIAMVLVSVMLRKLYLIVGTSLKRLEASTRSPIVSYFNATLDGLPVVKAAKVENMLKEDFDSRQDVHISASFMYLCITRAFCLSVECIFTIFIGVVISRFSIINTEGMDVSLAIFESFLLAKSINFAFLKWAEIETNMTSVERVLQYSRSNRERSQGRLNGIYSKFATIKFENVSIFRSDECEPVLKDITFTVKPKEKIGIVGRTGVGKSSLISSFFNLESFEGRILVNDVNVKVLSLEFLRSYISVLTQDTFIFKGTIRENIDPFNEYSDREIRTVLENVNLKKFSYELNLEICDQDSIFSAGQKQLLCLARIMLKNNTVVLLDSPTANVDKETENLICNLIVDKFINCTMMIITDSSQVLSLCDKVFILSKCSVTETDKESFLGQNKNAVFV